MFLGYLTGVASVVIFPIDTGAFFVEQMRLHNSVTDGMNLIPFASILDGDESSVVVRQLLLNVVLGIPFGLAMPFLGVRGPRRVLALGAVFVVGIETLQFGMNIAYQFDYRTVDVDDALANFVGVVVGLLLFEVIAVVYQFMRLTQDDVGGYLHGVFTNPRAPEPTGIREGSRTGRDLPTSART